ncbi:unnamed protein product [Mycena citricolor]|uniref:Uncharacterized protein n=1 Tax=Mycena citricolor TaxID=2018698 RepID=A0AAD2HCM4_9AGAR|nr:unnamed protein product [Mycena citricolor]
MSCQSSGKVAHSTVYAKTLRRRYGDRHPRMWLLLNLRPTTVP